ncbi:MAG: hypothetical protein GX568_05750 [Candidatus Gastranaerophilales bacterium]|nr:hypothetical protein [Candidatus Gastranaerophilales bacterium]
MSERERFDEIEQEREERYCFRENRENKGWKDRNRNVRATPRNPPESQELDDY